VNLPRPAFAALLTASLIASCWGVYTRYVDLRAYDPVLGAAYRDLSLAQHRQTLQGTMSYPAQWRLLAFWLVDAGERVARLDPHVIDVTLKSATLAGTLLVMFRFAATRMTPLAAILAAALFLLGHMVAFASEAYAIYHTNDYIVVFGWAVALHALDRRRWALAAGAVFVAAWAKETIVLAVVLALLEAVRGRLPWRVAVGCVIAFAVPTFVLRTMYPAPISEWAWWTANLEKNLPFYSTAPGALRTAVQNDLKVLLFLNVGWMLFARACWQTRDRFVQSAALVLAAYVIAGPALYMFRELRHFLFVLVLVAPLVAAELERALGKRSTS
jgi:hypothetical protein